MSKPSFSNIDLWLFELAEGNLTPEQVAQLELFLLQNPELDVDRDMWEMAKVESDKQVYPHTASHFKRKPVGLYIGAASTLVIAGVVMMLNFTGVNAVANSNQVQFAENNAEVEIQQLEAEVASLKNENKRLQSLINEANVNDATLSTEVNEVVSNINRTGSSQGYTEAANQVITQQNNPNREFLVSAEEDQNSPLLVTAISDASENRNLLTDGVISLEQNEIGDLFEVNTNDLNVESTNQTESTISETPTQRQLAEEWRRNRMDWGKELSRMARKIKRMMDNPVALYNSRDPHYHVPGVLPQAINFSSNGTMLATRVQSLSRIQYLGQENELMTNTISADGYSYGIRGGIGVQMSHSYYKNGALQVGEVALTYSPKFSVSNFVSVEPSVRFKMGNKMLDHNKLNGVSQIEMNRGIAYDFGSESIPTGNSLWYKDVGAGLMINTKWFFAGAQVDNIFRHYDNIYDDASMNRFAGQHFVATIGTDWKSMNEKMILSPYAVYQQQESLSELWVGANFQYNWFTFGAGVSSNLDPAASIGMKFKHFTIHYNADYTTSAMLGSRALSHQLSLRFNTKPSPFGRRIIK